MAMRHCVAVRGSYHRTAALDGRRASRTIERPSSTDRDRSLPRSVPSTSRRSVASAQVSRRSCWRAASDGEDDRSRVDRDSITRNGCCRPGGARRRTTRRMVVAWTIQGLVVQTMTERVPGDVSARRSGSFRRRDPPRRRAPPPGRRRQPDPARLIDILRSMAPTSRRSAGRDDQPRHSRRRWVGEPVADLIVPIVGTGAHRARSGRTSRPRSTRSRSCALPPAGDRPTVIRARGAAPQGVRPDRGIAAGLVALGARVAGRRRRSPDRG